MRNNSKALQQHNDDVCHDVLQATQTASVEALETYIVQDRHAQPTAVLQASSDLMETEWEFFRDWGEYSYFEFRAGNPPFESSSHDWYGLYSAHDHGLDNLVVFDAAGHKQSTHKIDHLNCGDPSFDTRGSACGCRVVDVSEQTHTVLSRCRTQHGDYDGTVRREWLSVLHSDDFSPAGFINLSSKDVRTIHAIAVGDNHPYVVTLESGDPLKVYPIPMRP